MQSIINLEILNSNLKKYNIFVDNDFFKLHIQGNSDFNVINKLLPNLNISIDEISILKDEGLLKLEGPFKIHYVKMEKQYLYDLNGGGDVLKTKLHTSYDVSITYSLKGIVAGANHKIDDMEMKIRNKKLGTQCCFYIYKHHIKLFLMFF